MNRFSHFSLVFVPLILALGLPGCNDSDDKESPVGASIGGTWSGVYYVEGHSSTRITAKIGQDGDAVSISTSKPESPGQRLSGRIYADAHMELTDASDGETWSSLQPANSHHVKIGDYVRQPTAQDRLEGNDVAMRIIDLER